MDVHISGNETSSLCVASAAVPNDKADCEITFIFLLATHSNLVPFRATCHTTVHLGEHTRIMDHNHLTPCYKAKYELAVRSDVPKSMIGLCNLGAELIAVAKRASKNAIRVLMFEVLTEEWCEEHVSCMQNNISRWQEDGMVEVWQLKRTHNDVVNAVENASFASGKAVTQPKEQLHMRLRVPQALSYRTVCTVGVRDSSYSTSCNEIVIVPETSCRGRVAIVLYFENTPVQNLRQIYKIAQSDTDDSAARCMHSIISTIADMDTNKITQAFTQSLSRPLMVAPDLTRMASCDHLASLSPRHLRWRD